jgi:AcrR family transcriptional regulator
VVTLSFSPLTDEVKRLIFGVIAVSVSPPSRSKGEVVKDFRTGEILDAARRVIGELGYGDASMERIAHAASVAKGTLYLYFKSKESLLQAVLEHGYAELMERTRARTLRARGPLAKLREVAHAFLEHSLAHQAFYRALRENPEIGPEGVTEISRRLRALVDDYIHHVSALVERGIKTGELRPVEAERAARLLVELLRGAVADRLREAHADAIEDDVDLVVDFFLHGVASGGRR